MATELSGRRSKKKQVCGLSEMSVEHSGGEKRLTKARTQRPGQKFEFI